MLEQIAVGMIVGFLLMVLGIFLRPWLERLLNPKAKREAQVKQGADDAIQPIIQNIAGDLQQEIHHHYNHITTAANTVYVTTGQGPMVIPDPHKIYPNLPSTSSTVLRPSGGWPWESGLEQPLNGASWDASENNDPSRED